jgi:hypothetical protein
MVLDQGEKSNYNADDGNRIWNQCQQAGIDDCRLTMASPQTFRPVELSWVRTGRYEADGKEELWGGYY